MDMKILAVGVALLCVLIICAYFYVTGVGTTPKKQAPMNKWVITRALWGQNGAQVDVTAKAQALFGQTGLMTNEPRILFGDHAPGLRKTLNMQYIDDIGSARTYNFTEGAFVWPANGVQL